VYWAAISIHTWISVEFGPQRLGTLSKWITHGVINVMLLVISIIELSVKNFEAGTPNTPSAQLITVRPGTLYSIAWEQFPLAWVWGAVGIVICVFCVGWILVKSLKHQTVETFRWSRNFRVVAFLLVLLVDNSYKWGMEGYVIATVKDAILDYETWLECTGVSPNGPCPYNRIYGFEFPFFYWYIFTTPILTALLFLLNPDIFRHWRQAVDSRTNPFTLTATTAQASSTKDGTSVETSITES